MENKLRILILAYDFRPRLGGVATCGYEIARTLAKVSGVKIKVVARDLPGAEEFDRHEDFETRRVKLSYVGFRAIPQLCWEISHELKTFRPQAIIGMLWLPSGVAGLILAPVLWFKGIPIFVFAHGVEMLESTNTTKKKIRRYLSPIKKLVFGFTKGVFAVSNYTRGLVVSLCSVNPEKVRVVYNGVNPVEFFFKPPSLNLSRKFGLENKRVFLTVSRLEDYKGIDRVISSLRAVKAKYPDVVYLVVGQGADRPRLERLVQHYDVQENVVFAGTPSFEELNDYYSLAECFMLITRSDLEKPNVEGFGIVFLEAAACEKPSIGGRSGGIPDAVVDGETGWLVNPHDDREISKAMLDCLDNPGKAKQLGRNGRERVLRSFTWETVASKVLSEVKNHVRN